MGNAHHQQRVLGTLDFIIFIVTIVVVFIVISIMSNVIHVFLCCVCVTGGEGEGWQERREPYRRSRIDKRELRAFLFIFLVALLKG